MFGVLLGKNSLTEEVLVHSIEYTNENGHSSTVFDEGRCPSDVFSDELAILLAALAPLFSDISIASIPDDIALDIGDSKLADMRICRMSSTGVDTRFMVRFAHVDGSLEPFFKQPSASPDNRDVLETVLQPALRIAERLRTVYEGKLAPYPRHRLQAHEDELQQISEKAVRVITSRR